MQGCWRDFHAERLVGGSLDNPRIMQTVSLSTLPVSAISGPDCHANSISFSVESMENVPEKMFEGAGDVAPLIECLPRRHEALSSIPSSVKWYGGACL